MGSRTSNWCRLNLIPDYLWSAWYQNIYLYHNICLKLTMLFIDQDWVSNWHFPLRSHNKLVVNKASGSFSSNLLPGFVYLSRAFLNLHVDLYLYRFILSSTSCSSIWYNSEFHHCYCFCQMYVIYWVDSIYFMSISKLEK